MMLISCGDTSISRKRVDSNLPTLAQSNSLRALSSEAQAIKESQNQALWGYYRDASKQRWYISPVTTSKSTIYSLMAIKDNRAGWGTVGSNVAAMNLTNESVTVDYIADNTQCQYFDAGWGVYNTDCLIQSDIEKIRNSTVKVDWWFFRNSTTNAWYIINPSGSVYKFASKDGQYDWQPIDMEGDKPSFYVENGKKYFKYTTQSIFNLNSPTDESKNFPKTGCSFSDVPKLDKDYAYITALCQSNIDVGTSSSAYDKFEPTKLATLAEVVTVANYAANYNAMVNLCTTAQYLNASKEECHLDYASTKGFSDKSASDSVTVGETILYTMKLLYNKDFTLSDASTFVKNNGILEDGISTSSKITRAQMARIILSMAGIYAKEATPSNLRSTTALPSLPMGINPPTADTPLVESELPSAYGEGVDIVDEAASNCPSDPTLRASSSECSYEGIKRETIMPTLSISEPVTTNSDTTTDTATKVVETAKESVGTTTPFVDSTHTHDMLFVNSVLGLPTTTATTTELVEEYKAQNKTVDLPNAQVGDIIVYKPEASSDNLPHIAIIASESTEIGVPNFNGVQETPIVSGSVDTVIPLSAFELPTIDTTNEKKNLLNEIPLIVNSGRVYGVLGAGESKSYNFLGKEGQTIRLNFSGFNYSTPLSVSIFKSVDAHSGIYLERNQYKWDGDLLKTTLDKTASYTIRVYQQGGEEYHKPDFKYAFNLTCDDKPCTQFGDFDSPIKPKYVTLEEVGKYNIDYSGDVDYYLLQIPYSGLVNVRIKSRILNNEIQTGINIDSDVYTNMSAVMYRLKDNKRISSGTFLQTYGVYLDKGDYLIQVRQSNREYDVEPYFMKVYYPKSTANIFSDITTGLMWQDDYETIDSYYQMSWSDAINYCSNRFRNGYMDWRLPSLEEFKTIVDQNNYPAIITGFENTKAMPYWTSTTTSTDTSRAYYVSPTGGIGSIIKTSTNYNVRCVRGEQR